MLIDALRALRAAPVVTAFILCILTITISVATTTFSVVDAVVLRPLPFDDAGELVVIEHHRGDRVLTQARAMSAVQFLALREQVEGLQTLAAVARGSQTLTAADEPERIWSARVTASLFDVLRVRPIAGQAFTPAHEVTGSDRVAIIGYGLWQRRFQGDAGIVGRTIQTEAGPLVVLGVMPRGFSYPIVDDRIVEIWTPYVIPENELGQSQSSYLHVVGRLRQRTAIEQAQLQADAVRKGLAAADKDRYSPAGRFALTSLSEAVAGPVRGWLVLVLAAVGLLLVIACANVANLLLTRAIQRGRELGIRSALGATRGRLVASLLLEGLLLSLLAVALALLISSWGIDVAKKSLPAGIARAESIALDFRVFITAVIAAMVTGVLFGIVPALQASGGDLVAVLKQGAGTVTPSRSRWRASVLVAEIAFATVLLVATTLFVASFVRLTRADLGFDRSDLLVVTGHDGIAGTMAEVTQRLQAIPGVVAVGGAAAGSPPLVAAGFEGGSSATRLQLPDAPANAVPLLVEFNRVSARYFAAAQIPLLRGRVFDDADHPKSDIVVLNDIAARHLFGDRDPIGRDVAAFGNARATVVGVVANVHMRGPETAAGPQAYFPGPPNAGSYSYLVRTAGPVASVIPALHDAIASLRPTGSRPARIRPIEDAFRNITARRRFSASTMAIFGLLAVLIGAAGVYAVMASVVAQRTREIGVRMALGATSSRIVAGILGQMSAYVALGLAIGLPSGWLVSRSFAALFFEVRSTDAWVYLVVAGLLGVVGVTAAALPARRASHVDPLLALRSE